MRLKERFLLPAALLAGACCQPGCIVFFQKENVPGVDPRARSPAFVEDVRGRTPLQHARSGRDDAKMIELLVGRGGR